MRVKQLSVGHWRNFEGVSVEVPKDANLVCLIGENGTGKSNMLELVATAAHTLGLSAGLPLRRGSPTGEPHEFSVTIEVSESVVPRTAALEAAVSPFEASLPEWDGTLTFFSQHPAQARFPELGPVQSWSWPTASQIRHRAPGLELESPYFSSSVKKSTTSIWTLIAPLAK
jgi:recombinational DNA repair ATPase RecF